MSKMEQEFEKNLDNAKYDLYGAVKIWLDKTAPYSIKQKTELMVKALAKAEGK